MQAGLTGRDHSISNRAMSGDSDLSGENDVLAHVGRSCQSYLGAEQCVFSHARSMAYLHQVIDLGAPRNPRNAHAGPVDTGVGLDLHLIGDLDRSGLCDLVPAPVLVLGETEAIGADDGAVLQDDMVAYPAAFADDGMRVREKVSADAYIAGKSRHAAAG